MATSTPVGPEVRTATAADAVAGVVPRAVAAPVDTAGLAATMRSSHDPGDAVVVRGSGTTLDWGPPPRRLDLVVDTRAITGVVEHVAGDLVATVRAGTTLAQLQAVVAERGQRLALDGVPGEATLGGLVAAGVSGPSRMRYGTLRDLVIGATFVRADGVVAHTGGKVVKNVAGFDLGKLLHGSRGTLAVISELVVRLHPLPPASRWVTVSVGSAMEAGDVRAAVAGAQAVPVGLEVDWPGADGTGRVAVLLEGPAATVDERARRLASTIGGEVTDVVPSWWGVSPARRGDVVVRASVVVDGLAGLLGALHRAGAAAGVGIALRGSAGVGSLELAIAGADGPGVVAEALEVTRRQAEVGGGSAVVLDGPAPLLDGVDRWGRVEGLALMRAVKARLDPSDRLAPGRFVGGI